MWCMGALYTSKLLRLRLSKRDRETLWLLRRRQDQSFNMGVETGLAQQPDEPLPAPMTAWKRLTGWRADGTLPPHGVVLQRAGVAAGVDAVRKWRLARRECERDAAYWTERAGAEDASPRVLRKAARAVRRLERHLVAGTKRLYRSRKHIERTGGPALVYLAGARLEEDAVVLPAARGRPPLRLTLAESFTPPDGSTWTGAVHLVDITDRKGRVTRRTRPRHRTYVARAILTEPAPETREPERLDEVLGVDVGVAVTAYGSDGSQHHLPDESEATARIRAAQRRRARCGKGSRRHRKRRQAHRYPAAPPREPPAQRPPPRRPGARLHAGCACRGRRGPESAQHGPRGEGHGRPSGHRCARQDRAQPRALARGPGRAARFHRASVPAPGRGVPPRRGPGHLADLQRVWGGGDPRDSSGVPLPGVRTKVQRGPQRRAQYPRQGVSASRGGSAAGAVVGSRRGHSPASPARTSTMMPAGTFVYTPHSNGSPYPEAARHRAATREHQSEQPLAGRRGKHHGAARGADLVTFRRARASTFSPWRHRERVSGDSRLTTHRPLSHNRAGE